MLNLLINLIFVGIIGAILYGIYRMPWVKWRVKRFTNKHRKILLAIGAGVLWVLILRHIIVPRM